MVKVVTICRLSMKNCHTCNQKSRSDGTSLIGFTIEAPPAKSKMANRGPQNGREGLKRCQFGHSRQLLQNMFFHPSTPSMKKVDDGEKKNKKIK